MQAEASPAPETIIEPSVELGLQLAGERNLFWSLPDAFAASAGYSTERHWWEYYVKPGVRAQQSLADGVKLYGQLSAVG